MNKPIIVPVIMSGGAGTRLWPMSRQAMPKQLHAVFGQNTLLQETAIRVPTDAGFTNPIVICAAAHTEQVQQQLSAISVNPAQLITEPCPRNTAPCAAIAAMAVKKQFGADTLVLLLAADHVIADPVEFRSIVHKAAETAANGHIVTFGPKPTSPETGYGYLLAGNNIADQVCQLDKFVEKPDIETAKNYLQDGRYLWNSGMFLFKAQTMLDEIFNHRPKIHKAATTAWNQSRIVDNHLLLDETAFAACPSESVDNAVMENTNLGAVIALDAGWSDIGSWAAIHELSQQDERKNAGFGSVIHIDTENCLFRSDGIRIAAIGVSNLAVIATKNAVLILPLDQAQKVKDLVEQLPKDEC
ncbi:MAG: mannose-1-phosphate guanylyltransferase/mannose-6-phosphate isomerase [Robiginitomaculum sp.]|nr:mannose-1-phosphate guanylyltransferase/mannose-6-phosphate isomerase [Robiginitomaculum sp.]